MRRKPHPQHAAIAKALGTTPGSLLALLAIKAGRGSLNRGSWLQEKGLVGVEPVTYAWTLTPAGAELLARARAMGF
jgi:hypothetical protein